MSLDLSDAIALAQDLMKTSGDFRVHDPEMAAEFSNRAYEICDDLGIDRALIGEPAVEVKEQPADDDRPTSSASVTPATADVIDEDTRQTNEQLNNLLQQQARVLQNVHEAESAPAFKPKKRSFKLFGRPVGQGFGALQSA